jgi:hypothetical protein
MLALGVGLGSLGMCGCGLLLDGAYLISNKHYDETVQERKPTGRVRTAVEYEASVSVDGSVHLTCEERERRIERASSVQKTFERRGGFDSPVYVGTAVLSGLAAGAISGVIAAICLQKPQDPKAEQLSCLNMLYGAPFAFDVGWSAIRAATAKPAKLVEKHSTEAILALSEKPVRTAALRCDSVRVVLGQAVDHFDPSEADILNGMTDRQARLQDGAVAVAVAPDGTITPKAQPGVLRAWLDDGALDLWVVDAEDRPHSLHVPRCEVLRPAAGVLAPDAQFKLQQACPPPPPPPQR